MQLFKQAVSEFETQATLGKTNDVNLADVFNHLASSMPSTFSIFIGAVGSLGCLGMMSCNIANAYDIHNTNQEIYRLNPLPTFRACLNDDLLSPTAIAAIKAVAALQSQFAQQAYTTIKDEIMAASYNQLRASIAKNLIIGTPLTLGFMYFWYINHKKRSTLYKMAIHLVKTVAEKNINYDNTHLCDKAQQLIATIQNQM
jgi:hypothetical protein